MSCEQVIICNGLSTAYGTMLLRLARDRARLKTQGIGYVRTGTAPLYGLASHEPLPRRLRRAQDMEHYARERLADWLQSFNAEAGQYKTLLFAVFCPWAEPLEHLRRELRALPELRRARFRLLLHASPQEAVLEQRLRLAGTRQGLEFWNHEWLQSDVGHLADMAARLGVAYGRPNVAVLAGDAEPAESPCDADAEQALYAMLGVPPPPPSDPLRCRLVLRSREARHMQSLYGQLNNVWPGEIQAPLLLDALQKAERDPAASGVLDFRSMASPTEIHALRERCAPGNARLAALYPATEKLLAVPPERESSPPVWEPYQGLRRDAVGALLECLPDAVANGLHGVLRVSEPVLTAQHHVVLAGLDESRPMPAWRPSPPARVKVSVLVQTYNQEAYVAEALDSILAQKTGFGVEIVVVDDASGDGTRAVIDRYARRYGNIRPIFLARRSNAGQNTLALFRHARAPYVALCDGDDYFTDPDKLQIQADYLDAHPDCGLCFHPVRLVWEGGGPESIHPDWNALKLHPQDRYELTDLLRVNFIQTNSVMYRWRFGAGIPAWFDPMLVPGDWYWHLLHAEHGCIGFMDRAMSVYRRHGKSLFWRPREASSVGHRVRFGIRELRLYQRVEQHFGRTAHAALAPLINGVFADLLKQYRETKEAAHLNKAVRCFPEFAQEFLKELQLADGREPYIQEISR